MKKGDMEGVNEKALTAVAPGNQSVQSDKPEKQNLVHCRRDLVRTGRGRGEHCY